MINKRRNFRFVTLGPMVVLLISLICSGILAGANSTGEKGARTRPSADTRPAEVERAVIITIIDEITDVTYDSIERRLKPARAEGIDFVIFELDTPGGVLGSTLEICNTIKGLRDSGVRTYAWVNNQAYSAGTIIALATDGVIMTSNATMGDCQPIMVIGMGASAVPESIEAKITSPVLAELRDSARRNKYDWDMVLSLIRPEMELFWLVNITSQEKRFVNATERDELFGLMDFEDDEDEDGKRSKRSRRSYVEPIPDSLSKTDWKYVKEDPNIDGEIHQPVVSSRELLTMRAVEAKAYGFCDVILNEEKDIADHFNITGTIERVESTVLESFIEWLASPMVRAVLFLLMLLGAYIEFQSPGLGLPGAVAVVALILFLGAPYLAGYAMPWEIGVIVLGIALIAVEIFVIPGFGVAGICGLLLLLIGLVGSYVPEEPFEDDSWFPHWPRYKGTYTSMKYALYSMAGGFGVALVGMVLLARYFPKIPVAGRIIALNPVPEQVAADDPYKGVAEVGMAGVSQGPLRPAGKARFGPAVVDVVTQGDFLNPGTKIEVVERHGNRVVVRKVD